MSKIADNYFSCKETPVNFPTGLKLQNVAESPTSKLRIISQIPGPGNYTGPVDFFFNVNENPTTSIHFNGYMYNLSQSYLCIPGIHKIAGEAKVCDAELVTVFNPSQASSTPQSPIMLCIPVESGIRINPKSQKYFATLSTGVTANRPTLGSILPPKPKFLAYNGFNFLLRLSTTDTLKTCNDISLSPTNNVRYLVCQNAIGMAVADYDRLNGQLARKPRPVGANDYDPLEQLVKPPVSNDQASNARFTQLTTLITNVIIEAGDAVALPSVKDSNGVPIDSMTCKRIRPGGAAGLRIDMTKGGTSTLKDELSQTQNDLNTMDLGKIDPGTPSTPANIQPGDIERALSIFFGILLGITVCAAIAVFVQWYVYGKTYFDVLNFKEKAVVALPSTGTGFKLSSVPQMLCPKD